MKRLNYPEKIGEVHGRLKIVSFDGMDHASKALVTVVCDCGGFRQVRYNNLSQGRTTSCGCLSSEKTAERNFKHGLSGHSAFQCWVDMNKRCHTPRDANYPNYGGRGITVCPEWQDGPEQFIADMGEKPPGMTLDRKDNNLGYSASNCEWVTMQDQQNNKRTNVLLAHEGESMTIAQWARKLGMKKVTLTGRIASGWSTEAALTTPVKRPTSAIDTNEKEAHV